jgi:glucose-1-phosphate thymidylyltransferase
VVVTDRDGYMTRIVEKPSEPISRLANIGLYYVRDWRALYQGVHWTLGQPQQKGEWFLTDAFQHMIDHGRRIRVAEVSGWYDCGKVETLLETNHELLRRGRAAAPSPRAGVELVPPVRIAEGVTLADCVVGPNVTVDPGVTIRGSTVRHAIVGARARITDATVEHCLVGDDAVLTRQELRGMVVARDEVAPAR